MNLTFNDKYMCPFCAYIGIVATFRKKNENGTYNRKTFQCPECHQVMRRNTLMRDITAREWAIWLYASIKVWNKKGDKFYDRIAKTPTGKFVLAQRVYDMGLADDFWNGWKEAKTYDEERLKSVVSNAYIPKKVQTRLI
jgi:hypothetical protein